MRLNVWLILIVLFAFYLRIIGINYPSGLCYDELFSWNIANSDTAFGVIQGLVNTDYHPPLYFLALHYWIKMLGDSDCILRLLSVLFSLSCVITGYFIAKTYKNRALGLICAGYFSFVYLFIRQAQVVRFYEAALLFSLLCVLFSIKLLKKFSKKNLIFFMLSNLALLYTQTTAVIFVFVEITVFGLVLYKYKRKCIKPFIKSCLLAFVFYIPQFIIFILQLYNSHQTFWQNPWEWSITSRVGSCYLFNLWSMLTVCDLDFVSLWFRFLLIMTCVLYAIYKSYKEKDKCLLFISSFFACFSLLYLVLHQVHIITLYCNYDYYLIIDALFLITFLMAFATKRNILLALILCLHIYFGIFLTYSKNHITKEGSNRFRAPLTYISSNFKTNAIVYSPYGDKLIKKYSPGLNTLEIDGDKLFTMKGWQKEAPKVFDVDFDSWSINNKKEYFRKYLVDKKPSKALFKTYDSAVNSLKKGDYFIVLCAKSRYFEQHTIDYVVSNVYYYNFNSKSSMIVAKITNDILKLAKEDSRLMLENDIYSEGDWLIAAFKKL